MSSFIKPRFGARTGAAVAITATAITCSCFAGQPFFTTNRTLPTGEVLAGAVAPEDDLDASEADFAASGSATGTAFSEITASFDATVGVRFSSDGSIVRLLGPVVPNTVAKGVVIQGSNSLGDSVGFYRYSQPPLPSVRHAVPARWDRQGNVTPLGVLHPPGSISGLRDRAHDISDSGFVAGDSELTTGGVTAVRWEAGTTTPTALPGVYAGTTDSILSLGYAVNNSGTVVGMSFPASSSLNGLATRWAAGGTTGVSLDTVDIGTSGLPFYYLATDINDAGTTIGEAKTNSGAFGTAIRWNANSTAATTLQGIGTDGHGRTLTRARDINNSNTVVGEAYVSDADGNVSSSRAVRWDAGTGTPTMLASLNGQLAEAHAINDAGYIVGTDYNGTNRAVVWLPDGTEIDLNTLIDPTSGYTLTNAWSISEDNWISGVATYGPAGPGGFPDTPHNFLIQLPEPASIAAFSAAASLLLKRRRRAFHCAAAGGFVAASVAGSCFAGQPFFTTNRTLPTGEVLAGGIAPDSAQSEADFASSGSAVGNVLSNTTSGFDSEIGVRFSSDGSIVRLLAPTVPNSTPKGVVIEGGNALGDSVGYYSYRTTQFGIQRYVPARWDRQGNVTPLGLLHQPFNGTSFGDAAYDISDTGIVAGSSQQTVTRPTAVRWDAGSTTPTPLPGIIAGADNVCSVGFAVSNAGTVVGTSYVPSNTNENQPGFATRWAAGGTTGVSLDTVNTGMSGLTFFYRATDLNDEGTTIGDARNYSSAFGTAVRWDATSSAATLLQGIGTDSSGRTLTRAWDINNSDTVVGEAWVSDASGNVTSSRAVRWDAGTGTPTMLASLAGQLAEAHAINDAGYIVGTDYNGTARAVVWLPNGTEIDLNTLIDSASGYTLTNAWSISEDNWVSGVATIPTVTPNGVLDTPHNFLLQLPEPASLASLGLAAVVLRRRGR